MAEVTILPNQTLSATVWSDLGPLRTVSPPVIKYLVSQVADMLSNQSHTKGALAVESIAMELENEGVVWSSKKIVRVCDALQTVIIANQKSHRLNPETAAASLNDEITARSAI